MGSLMLVAAAVLWAYWPWIALGLGLILATAIYEARHG